MAPPPRMQGRLVLMLASVGLLVGVLSLQPWWPHRLERAVWLAIAILLWIPALVRARVERPFVTGLATAFLGLLLAGLVNAVFVANFAAAHPELLADLEEQLGQEVPLGQLRYLLVLWSVLSGLVYGLPVGLATWAFVRSRKAKDETEAGRAPGATAAQEQDRHEGVPPAGAEGEAASGAAKRNGP